MSAEVREAIKKVVPQLPGETSAGYEALVAYIEMGGVVLTEFAARVGRCRNTVARWSKKNRWKERSERFWRGALPVWADATVSLKAPEGWREQTLEKIDERRRELMEREWVAHEELLRIAEVVIGQWKKGAWHLRAAPLGALAALIELTFRLGRGAIGEKGPLGAGPVLRELEKELEAAYEAQGKGGGSG